MPTLLEINITSNHGSTGKIAEAVGLLMRQRGWDVYLAHGARYVNPSSLQSYQIQNKCGEYLHAMKSFLLDADGLGSKGATKKLVEFIRHIKPDIIHIHNLHGYYLNYEVLFGYLNTTDIQIVMTLHDCWTFTGHCTHFVTAGCNKWKTMCHDCPLTRSVPRSLFLDMSRRNFLKKISTIAANKNLHLVGVSRWICGLIGESMYKGFSLSYIANGIDTTIFTPSSRYRHEDGRVRVLSVANVWNRDKGLYDIYRLRSLLPADRYDILLVGLDKRQIRNLPHGISGIGRTANQEELARIYASCDVFINPTYADTFPTTNLEALASGLPVITYDTGGSPEAVDMSTGIVVPQGDIQAMAEAILSLPTDNSITRQACRERAVTRYDRDKRFMDYADLFESLLSKPPK
ncbi:MAG: glycosyltransferase [bacterium]|nr:glycosyltransferase [Bacteroidales bacterium]MDO4209334.1 glycosyltransferase [bacterium]MDY3355465.1 glycosyltransferase [Prevotella sp.]MDD7619810.1 glycosyltransferase [Bacteroidales bacterium]MDY4431910.1 glycosyltransferase [Prevotella sp.]